jgi:hypothetical protein
LQRLSGHGVRYALGHRQRTSKPRLVWWDVQAHFSFLAGGVTVVSQRSSAVFQIGMARAPSSHRVKSRCNVGS